MKTAYLMSLSRSGSTFLQTMLAERFGGLALGEANRAVNYFRNGRSDRFENARLAIADDPSQVPTKCLCGAERIECPFWSTVEPALHVGSSLDAFRHAHAQAERSGRGRFVIDSTKIIEPFDDLYLKGAVVPKEDLRLVFLFRDLRGWVDSFQRQMPVRKAAGSRVPFAHSRPADAWRWYSWNKRMLAKVEEWGVRTLLLSYEKLCLDFEGTLRTLSEFLGEPLAPVGDKTLLEGGGAGEVHELFGNQGFKSARGSVPRHTPRYDSRWFHQDHWYQRTFATGFIRRFNTELFRMAESEPIRELRTTQTISLPSTERAAA